MAETKNATYKEITAENQFSDPLAVKPMEEGGVRTVQVSIHPTGFLATVVVQVKRSDQDDWRDVDSFTAGVERLYDLSGNWQIRAGVKTGGFTSGTVEVELS